MAKLLAVLDSNGRKISEITPIEARKMYKAEKIEYLDDRRAVQMKDSTGERILDKIPRGLSARPDGELTGRYTSARMSGGDPLAIAAVDGWRPKHQPVLHMSAQH
jgi:hypothetical protein